MSGYLLNDIYDVLGHIKLRRVMFLGNEHTFQSLESFVTGYTMAAREEQLQKDNLPKFTYFNTWLLGHLKKNYGEAGGWHWQISNRNPNNDEKAFEEFFHYLELFKKSKLSKRLMVLTDNTIRVNESTAIKRYRLLQDSADGAHEVPVMRSAMIRWINIEHSKTVWIEFVDKNNNVIGEPWFINAKKAAKSLSDEFGEFTNEWIEIKSE